MTNIELFSYFLESINCKLNLYEYPRKVLFLYNGTILNPMYYYSYSNPQITIENIQIHNLQKIIVIDFENYIKNFSEFISNEFGLEIDKEIELIFSEIKKNNELDKILNDVMEEINPGLKIIISFNHVGGWKHKITVNYGTTIDQLLKKYLKRVNKVYLCESNKLIFLYNAVQLKLGDNTSVEKFFKNSINPKIVVNEIGDYFSELHESEKIYSHFEELYKKLKLYLDPQWEPPKRESPEPPKLPKEYAVGKITVKFNKKGKIVKIKMDAENMVAELINEYFIKTGTSTGLFIFNGEILSPCDTFSLAEVGLKNNSEIFVSKSKDK